MLNLLSEFTPVLSGIVLGMIIGGFKVFLTGGVVDDRTNLERD